MHLLFISNDGLYLNNDINNLENKDSSNTAINRAKSSLNEASNDNNNTNRYSNEWKIVKKKEKKFSKNNCFHKNLSPNEKNKYNDNKNNFTNFRKQKKILIGSNTTSEIKGIEGRLHFYTSRWDKSTTIDKVKEHVRKITRDTDISVEEVPLKFVSMKAFKIITRKTHYDAMYSLDNWPNNVLISRFWYSNKKKQTNQASLNTVNKQQAPIEDKIEVDRN